MLWLVPWIIEQATKSDAKSEMLHAKILSLLLPAYRSHSEQLFRLKKGVFARQTGMTLQDTKFFDVVFKRCQAAWVALSWTPFGPQPDDCEMQVSHVLQHIPATFVSCAVHFNGDESWCGEMVNLIARLRDEFNHHAAVIMQSFHRWASTPIPYDTDTDTNLVVALFFWACQQAQLHWALMACLVFTDSL